MKTGVFLTPGAARTAYQVGALHALIKEGGLRFDVIAASSVGALNGAFAAMGETEQLVEIWRNWKTEEVVQTDWTMLLRGGFFWAPGLASNRPEHETAIDPYVDEAKLQPGIRFRFNLANLTTGENVVVAYPGEKMPLPQAVGASVAVPVMFEPVSYDGMQYADGLTIDGCPLETLLLETGVERAFVIGVAPRTVQAKPCRNAYEAALRAGEWNQYSETLLALEEADAVNACIRAWEADRAALEAACRAVVEDEAVLETALAALRALYEAVEFPYQRGPVKVIPILPEAEIPMWFGDFDPERSRKLIEQGRQDALRVLEALPSNTGG